MFKSAICFSENAAVFVYRVAFEGENQIDDAVEAISAAGASWESSRSGPSELERHHVLVEAVSESEAMARVRGILEPIARFEGYAAAAVIDVHGETRRGPFYRSWEEIDWSADPSRSKLTAPQRTVLMFLRFTAEPTWIIASDLELDLPPVEEALRELQEQELVDSVLEPSGEHGKEESELDRWWFITDYGWDLLGLIKPPGYE